MPDFLNTVGIVAETRQTTDHYWKIKTRAKKRGGSQKKGRMNSGLRASIYDLGGKIT